MSSYLELVRQAALEELPLHVSPEWLKGLLKEIEALTPKPVRKLREVKGVTYRDEAWVMEGSRFGVHEKDAVSAMIRCSNTLTDADHAAIYALKDDPYEPVETVEAVVEEIAKYAMGFRHTEDYVIDYATRLRAAVLAEGVQSGS